MSFFSSILKRLSADSQTLCAILWLHDCNFLNLWAAGEAKVLSPPVQPLSAFLTVHYPLYLSRNVSILISQITHNNVRFKPSHVFTFLTSYVFLNWKCLLLFFFSWMYSSLKEKKTLSRFARVLKQTICQPTNSFVRA